MALGGMERKGEIAKIETRRPDEKEKKRREREGGRGKVGSII